MEQRLSLITLTVDDVAETSRFFENGLGWVPAGGKTGEVAFYQTGGMGLALYARAALEAELGNGVPAGAVGTSAISWNARNQAEVDENFEKAHSAGAKVIKPPHGTHWGGYSCYLEIPGGHMLELAYNPLWKIAEDGSINIG